MQGGDRLLAPASSEFCAVNCNLGIGVRKKLVRAACKLFERDTQRAGDMRHVIRRLRQDIHDLERGIVQPATKLVARNLCRLR